MGLVDYISKKADNVGSIVSAAAGGLALGQFPQYLAQYVQRLGGHIDEAFRWGEKYPEIAARAADLKHGLEAIVDASGIMKLPEFLMNVDWSIATEAFANYVPGITIDAVGLAYFGVGALGGYVAYEVAKPIVKYGVIGGAKLGYRGLKAGYNGLKKVVKGKC